MNETKRSASAVPVTRKLFYAGTGWLAGLLIFLASENNAMKFSFVAAALVSAIFLFRFGKYLRYAVFTAFFMMLGALYFSVYQQAVYKRIVSYSGKEVTIRGKVTDLEHTGGSVRMSVKGKINGGATAVISFYCGDVNVDYYDRVSVKLKVAVPENTASFNAEDYNTSRGIYLEGSGSAELLENSGCGNHFMRAVRHLRDSSLGSILSVCPDQSGAFLAAMLCSEKSELSADTKLAVYRAGLGHLFAVSGTHIVLIFSFTQNLLSKVIVSKRLRKTAGLAVIWGFAMFAGLSPSVVRACIMMTMTCAGDFFDRRGDSANSLGAASILITASCPYLITSVSFVMSFAASFAISVLAPAICRGRTVYSAAQTAISYVCISICTLPLCAIFFSEISLVSLLANFALVPLCTLALALSFIFIITGFRFTIAIRAAGLLSRLVIILCSGATRLPFSYIGTYYSKTLMIWGTLAIVGLIYCALSKRRKTSDIAKCIAAYAVVCIMSAALTYMPYKDKIIIYPDKNGYTAVMVSDRAAYIFDMGSSAGSRYSAARDAERYNTSVSYIFISGKAMFGSIKYKEEFPSGTLYFSPEYDFPERGVYGLISDITTNSARIGIDDGGFVFSTAEHTIEFYDDCFSLDGDEYYISGFGGREEKSLT